jgi:type II secretion system protein G
MKKKGFTLIELLVVVAIIALLAAMAVVALNNARARARDARRVADIRQIQTALEMYYLDHNSYPSGSTYISIENLCLKAGVGWTNQNCNTGTVYIASVPAAPRPADSCPDADNAYAYKQDSNNSYSLKYCLGASVGNVPAGTRTATPAGLF